MIYRCQLKKNAIYVCLNNLKQKLYFNKKIPIKTIKIPLNWQYFDYLAPHKWQLFPMIKGRHRSRTTKTITCHQNVKRKEQVYALLSQTWYVFFRREFIAVQRFTFCKKKTNLEESSKTILAVLLVYLLFLKHSIKTRESQKTIKVRNWKFLSISTY